MWFLFEFLLSDFDYLVVIVIVKSNQLFDSLQEFILTSSVGDFRKRLQLILAFHGQISTGIRLGIYSRYSILLIVV